MCAVVTGVHTWALPTQQRIVAAEHGRAGADREPRLAEIDRFGHAGAERIAGEIAVEAQRAVDVTAARYAVDRAVQKDDALGLIVVKRDRSEEHTSELQ